MGKKVIIAEKPSVAIEFSKALKINSKRYDGYLESSDYIVTWCVGHLVTMSYPEKYDENLKKWSIKTLPFIPKEYKYEVIENVKKQFDTVKTILTRQDVDTIYVCTDSGREGEYIYRLVDNMVGVVGKIKKRVWIDSQTEEEILNGIKNAKDISEYDNLAYSAFLRAKEDYLIGINFSRLLSVKYSYDLAMKLDEKHSAISIGRVMTCVLGMVVERENEILKFSKTKFYRVSANFLKEDMSFSGDWKVQENSTYYNSPLLYNDTGFLKENDAKKLREDLLASNDKVLIEDITKKNTKEKPPLLFNLAELQNECTKKYKISPDETLNIAQSLYEKKLITYPRTDARVLSSAVAKEINKNLNGLARNNKDEEIKGIIEKMIKEKYSTNISKSKFVNDSKITDHYAIIPTGSGFENYNNLNQIQKNVLNLIIKRFLSIFYPPAEYSKISIILSCGKEKFYTNSKVCTKLGYLEVSKKISNDENEKNTEDNESKTEENVKIDADILKKLKKGQELSIKDIDIKEGETSPPTRYTSGSIILAMENAGKLIEDDVLREQIKGSGIGTSATRAEIIKKLIRINYIDLNNKTQILTPSKKGLEIYKIVRKSMPDLLNPELTASWEKGLAMVATGEIKPDAFMDKLENYIIKKVNRYKNLYV